MTTTAERIGVDPRDDWKASALCAEGDPDEWFPERNESPLAAQSICSRCPVRTECLEYAIVNDERYGVWGGTLPADREEIRKSRGIVRVPSRSEWDNEQRRRQADEILADYESIVRAGLDTQPLADKLGCSKSNLHKRMAWARQRRDGK